MNNSLSLFVKEMRKRFGLTHGRVFNYEIGKHNLYWPVPNEDIKKNTGRQMRQNFGYDGYDPNITMWENWEDAVADEDKTE